VAAERARRGLTVRTQVGKLLTGGGAVFMLILGGSSGLPAVASARLPDLLATLPGDLRLKRGEDGPFRLGVRPAGENIGAGTRAEDGHFWLGFRSAGENIGAGPLILEEPGRTAPP
jgi:hypothetical protein